MQEKSHHSSASSLRLAWMLAKRDLKNRYASSYAGTAWNVGVPLLYSLINVVVFSILMRGRMGAQYGDIPFALFYFVPFSLWTVFTEVTGRSTGILREYSYLISKIAFPVWVLPLIPLTSALISQGIIFVFVIGLLIIKGVVPGAMIWMFPVIWALSLAISIGFAYGISAISVYVPDMVPIVPLCTNIVFWLTPILYPATMVEASRMIWMRNIVMTLNPFYYMVETSRQAVFPGIPFNWEYIGVLVIVAAATLAIGAFIFRKLKPGFADVL
ncbi:MULTISPECIES: ABC transporter permease [Burkholderia]|uniref:ABC transporter permease n=2 Tax=Burkholderia cenocepacia TaxID=95486 RepID=A0ABD4UIV7_9BURK|nr:MULTISPECIES: ABC transporter permease [Burkholderia]MBR7966286.1 ABC transporter permease [Burkholderia cenocepacia]MBR8100003.1 ABC transporter permease [Burkholderia cenocepacia]MCW3499251.1 ABC transporter permease [Burkholderia cenocepacia]MCW3506835.1 ABC transporter permease [Burkholderia cenocepacia]MCW3514192.1 ABC transporter permease [Burkholderia cenocepacia]